MNLKLAILSILDACGEYALTKPSLKTETQTRVGGRVGDGEFSDALKSIQDKGWVGTRIDPLTDDTRYFITGTGKTALHQ